MLRSNLFNFAADNGQGPGAQLQPSYSPATAQLQPSLPQLASACSVLTNCIMNHDTPNIIEHGEYEIRKIYKICPKNQPISAFLLKYTTNDSQ